MLFPAPHKIYIARNASWFNSAWLAIWHLLVILFGVILWSCLIYGTFVFLKRTLITIYGCFLLSVKFLAYGLLGGLDTRDITPQEYFALHMEEAMRKALKK
jgi:hypothetical protein